MVLGAYGWVCLRASEEKEQATKMSQQIASPIREDMAFFCELGTGSDLAEWAMNAWGMNQWNERHIFSSYQENDREVKGFRMTVG